MEFWCDRCGTMIADYCDCEPPLVTEIEGVSAHGRKPMTPEDREALRQILAAALRRFSDLPSK